MKSPFTKWGKFFKDKFLVSQSLAAVRAAIGLVLFLTFPVDRAAARGAFTPEERVDDRSRATHSRLDTDRLDRTILSAGPTFHTGITVSYFHPAICQAQDSVRANRQTRSTAHAFFPIKRQSNHIPEIG